MDQGVTWAGPQGRAARACGRGWIVLVLGLVAIAALGAACGRPVPIPALFVQGPNQHGFSWAMSAGAAHDPFRDPAQEQAARRERVRQLVVRTRDARADTRAAADRLRQARAREQDAGAMQAESRGRHPYAILVAHEDRTSTRPRTQKKRQSRPPRAGPATERLDGTAATWRARLPRDMDRAEFVAIERALARQFPWLRRLSNGQDIIALYALRIAWTREAKLAQERYAALPDPARTIVSHEKRARARKRAPWDERRRQALRMLGELPNNTRIKLSELRADDFTRGATHIDSGGRRAMLHALDRHQGSVGLALDGGAIRVRVYLDGTPLPLRDGRLHFDAFFGTTAVALLEVQLAYHTAVLEIGELELGYFYRTHPAIAGVLLEGRFEDLIGAQVLARLDQEMGGGADELRIIDEIRQERLDRARGIRARTAAAMVPLTVIVSLFAIEGASDLFLQAFPGRAVADVLKELVALRRAGKAARELEKLPQVAYLREALGPQQARFLRGLGKLGARQRRALLAIGKKVDAEEHPDVMIKLMEGAARGHTDLIWIEAKLRKGHFSGAFVKSFTRYDANPTWRELKMLLDNTISPTTRQSLISKLAGFRGEEAAEALVHEPVFRRRFLNGSKEIIVSRGDGSLDIMAQTKDNASVVFAEVKNWSRAGWLTGRERVKEQLRRHNERIKDILTDGSRGGPPEVIHKLLMVEQSGWMRLREDKRKELVEEIQALGGWQIEVIPRNMIESSGQLIDRLRKPTSK